MLHPRKVKWVVFEVGLVSVVLLLLVVRSVIAVDFNITRDGLILSVLTFGLGMLVRELFVE